MYDVCCVWVRPNTRRGGRSWVIFIIVVLYFCLHLFWRVLSLICVLVLSDSWVIWIDLVRYFCGLGSPFFWGLWLVCVKMIIFLWSIGRMYDVCVWVRLNTRRGGRVWVIFTIVVLYFNLHLFWRVLSLIWVNVSLDLSASCANQIFDICLQILFCIGCGYTVEYCLDWVLT